MSLCLGCLRIGYICTRNIAIRIDKQWRRENRQHILSPSRASHTNIYSERKVNRASSPNKKHPKSSFCTK